MAEVRVMLKFDYAPPAEPESRHMWMLVSLEHLRTVNDLSALIRARYYPQHSGTISLYVHDCLLPPTESARLLRDNDVIRVLWIEFDPEDEDIDNDVQARPSRKRSWQRCEEDTEDRPAIRAKKRRCKPQGEESPRSRRETADVEDTEQVKSSESSRRKSKKKEVLEERAEEAITEESTQRNNRKKHSQDPTALKEAKKIQSLLRSNHESSSKREGSNDGPTSHQPKHTKSPSGSSSRRDSSSDHESSTKGKKPPKGLHKAKTGQKTKPNRDLSSSSSDQESSTTRKRPSKVANKAGANVSVMKTKPNHDSSAPKVRSGADSSSSSDHESCTMQKRPSKGANKAGANISVMKTKPNHDSSAPKVTSGADSSSSSDHESCTMQKRPSKGANKAGANISVMKTKPNHDSSAPKVTSGADSSSSSDHESCTMQKRPSKGANKAGANISVMKTKPNHDSSAPKVTSGADSSSSSDQELSTAKKKSSEATRNPSNPVFGKERRNDSSAPDNGDPIKRRSGDGVTARLLNGTSQKPYQEIPSSGCDLDIMQEPVTAQCTSNVVPSCVTNGHENGGTQQQYEPEPGLYNHGRGQGRGILLWRGQRGRGFRGQGRGNLPRRGQGGRGFRGPGDQRRGRGYNNQFFHSYDSPTLKKQQLEEPIANISVIIQNPAEIPKEDFDALPLLAAPPQAGKVIAFKNSAEIPKRDYDVLPLLAAPPQAGKVIAFKILELNENYSPELSDYKEGVVRSYDAVTQQIEVELIAQQKQRVPGKFDLVYESEDGMETVEYGDGPDCKIVEAWTSLISPRLVMDNGSEEGISLQPL